MTGLSRSRQLEGREKLGTDGVITGIVNLMVSGIQLVKSFILNQAEYDVTKNYGDINRRENVFGWGRKPPRYAQITLLFIHDISPFPIG